jgi:hypothetical protein
MTAVGGLADMRKFFAKALRLALLAAVLYFMAARLVLNLLTVDFEEGWAGQMLDIKNIWATLIRYIPFIMFAPVLCGILCRFLPYRETESDGSGKTPITVAASLMLAVSLWAAYELWVLLQYDLFHWGLYTPYGMIGERDVYGEAFAYRSVFLEYICYVLGEDYSSRMLFEAQNTVAKTYILIASILNALIVTSSKAVLRPEKGLAFIGAAFVAATCMLFPAMFLSASVAEAFVWYFLLLVVGAALCASWHNLCRMVIRKRNQ